MREPETDRRTPAHQRRTNVIASPAFGASTATSPAPPTIKPPRDLRQVSGHHLADIKGPAKSGRLILAVIVTEIVSNWHVALPLLDSAKLGY